MRNRTNGEIGRFILLLMASAGLLASGVAQASLMGRDLNSDGRADAYYDNALNITWLKDANYAAVELSDARRDAIIADVGSVPDAMIPGGHALTASDFQKSGANYTGSMTWWGAMAWAQDLTIGIYSGWRLSPISFGTTDPDYCRITKLGGGAAGAPYCAASGNELGYMYYYNLDGFGQGGVNDDKTGNQVSGKATLNNIGSVYWTDTEWGSAAWIFSFAAGWTDSDGAKELFGYSAWAVHSGDVGIPVPQPGTIPLFGAALAGLAFSCRRKVG